MAGFLSRVRSSFTTNSLGEFIKDLSTLGVNYNKEIARRSQSVGYYEKDQMRPGNLMNPYDMDDEYGIFLQAALMDVTSKKSIAFYDQSYTKKREELRKVAIQEEIEEILDILCDEAIVYDEKKMFASVGNLTIEIKNKEGFQEYLSKTFKKLYRTFGFQDDQTAWWMFRQFLIDGYISYEVIYSEDEKEIIGFKQIDPVTLQPTIDEEGRPMWVQFKGDPKHQRELYDSQVIYIAYSSVEKSTRDSYVERLIRPFNIMRIMENTRIIWAVVNAQFRTTFIIPMGGKSKNKAKESLAKLMQQYNERVDFDSDSGSLNVNGSPNMPFYRNYWLPEKDGATPQIQNVGGDGPQLDDTAVVEYFYNKLRSVSKIPFQRFDKEGGGGNVEFSADGIIRQEYRFGRFIDRIRTIFSEILLKPLIQQILIDYPEYQDDEAILSDLKMVYNKNNLFEEFKEQEIFEKRANFIMSLQGITNEMGAPWFDTEFLVERFLKLDEDDIKRNAELKKKNKPEEGEEGAGGFGF